MPPPKVIPTQAQISELRKLFLEKYEQQPPTVPFHPNDLERVKNEDIWCTRFLEMYDLDMKLAFNKLWETCTWRQEYGANDLTEDKLVQEYLNDGVIFARNRDIDGKPLLIFKTKLHVKGAKNMDEVMRVVVYWIERLHRETNMEKMTIFFDMAGTGLGNMDLDFVKRIIDIFKLYYPAALNYIIIYEMAWVLNAAFKVIKSFLPPKALEILKMINKKDIQTYVDKDNCFTSWGGNDAYEFTFVPEKRQQLPAKVTAEEPTATATTVTATATANGALPTSVDSNDLQNSHDKRVHFANSRPYAESEMPECERSYQSTMLRISPNDNIYFNRGENSESLIELTCISKQPITYKIQTTAPEKFRVRPRCGYLSPSESVSVSIMLKQDYHLGEASKDKFLVMCMLAPLGADPSQQSMSEAWKQKPANGVDTEQHRLTCHYRVAASGSQISGRCVTSSGGTPDCVEGIASIKSNNNVSDLSSHAKMLESQLRFTQILQCVTLVFLLALSVAVMYLLKMQLQRTSNSTVMDSCPMSNYGGTNV